MSLFQRKRKKIIYFSRNGVMIISCFIVMFLFILNTNLWPETPLTGHWKGTTNRHGHMSFDVSTDSTQWSNFRLYYYYYSSKCNESIHIYMGPFGPGIISSGTFTYSWNTFSFSGNFTSPTTATGTYVFTNHPVIFTYLPPWPAPPIFCYDWFSVSGTWTASIELPPKDDLIGTWDGSGVWYRNSETGAWVKMSIPANLVAAGDIDGDNTADLIGVWSSGLWVKYSSTGTWAKLCTPLPSNIASGDMDGDGRDDVLGTWSSGVWYKNSATGAWVKMSAVSADLVAAGDLDGDNTDDLIGVWSSGLWVKYSSSGAWTKICTPLPNHIASGDMNGDGRDDVLGTWISGVWYKDSVSGTWVKMCSVPAYLVTAGDIDGDGTDDLIGVWSSGLWVKYSLTGSWEKLCTPLPSDIDAGLFRTGWGGGAMSFDAPIGGVYVEGPGSIDNYVDLSSEGPGGWNFAYQEEENLVPQEKGLKIMMRTPGPGEPGFKYIEQKNLVPNEKPESKKKRKK